MKGKTFLEVGPRTRNKHSYQAATTIINSELKELFFRSCCPTHQNAFKLLVQNKILFCWYLFPWSRLIEHSTAEASPNTKMGKRSSDLSRGKIPPSPPRYDICLPTAAKLLLPSLLLLTELYPSFYNMHFSLLFQRKQTLKSWQSPSHMNHFSLANTFTLLSGYLL